MVEPRVTRLPNNFRWPNGHHIALIFNIAYEAWSQGKAPAHNLGRVNNTLGQVAVFAVLRVEAVAVLILLQDLADDNGALLISIARRVRRRE